VGPRAGLDRRKISSTPGFDSGPLLIIILSHQLGPDRPVSASSKSLFKGLPSLLPWHIIQHYSWLPVVVHSCYM